MAILLRGSVAAESILPAVSASFRAEQSSAQTLTGGVFDALTFGSEIFDTDSAFASNQLIVPASWDGKFIELTANLRTEFGSGNPTEIAVIIERSTDSGSNWDEVGYASEANKRFRQCGYMGVASDGDYFRASGYTNDSRDTLGDQHIFFAGGVLND